MVVKIPWQPVPCVTASSISGAAFHFANVLLASPHPAHTPFPIPHFPFPVPRTPFPGTTDPDGQHSRAHHSAHPQSHLSHVPTQSLVCPFWPCDERRVPPALCGGERLSPAGGRLSAGPELRVLRSSVLTGREVYNGNKSLSLSKRSFSHPVSSGGARGWCPQPAVW